MATEDVRIGLVGIGGIGNCHAGVWKNTPGAKVVACCDVVRERAERGVEQLGAEVYTDYEEMLDKAKLDAVDVCTWSGLHAEMGIAAAERGLHVLVEKPIDLSLERIDKLIEITRRKKLILTVIHQNRVGAEIQRAKKLIDEGVLGKLLSASTYIKWYRGQDYYDSASWRGTWRLDGGVLSNQGIHQIDQICWLAGPVAEVEYSYCATVNHKMEAEDIAIAHLRFENGARGVIEATTCAYDGLPTRSEVFGTKGSAMFEGSAVAYFKIEGEEIDINAESTEGKSDGRSDPMAIGLGGHEAQLLDFVQCIREGREPIITGESARVGVQCLNMIYQKAGLFKLGVD